MKTGKYLKYALGEILLVVIGILIALAINNWNEQRKNNIKEQAILVSLLAEVDNNIKTLESNMTMNMKNKSNAEKLASHTGPVNNGLTEVAFAKLYAQTFKHEINYTPANGVLNELINTGKISLIKSQPLRTTLSAWEAATESLKHQEAQLEKVRQRIYQLVMTDGNFRKMLDLTREEETWYTIPNGAFDSKNLKLLRHPEFENNLVLFIGAAAYLDFSFYQEHLKRLKDLQLSISNHLTNK